jgi:hypothetical protein
MLRRGPEPLDKPSIEVRHAGLSSAKKPVEDRPRTRDDCTLAIVVE